jgi:hypothetical protein
MLSDAFKQMLGLAAHDAATNSWFKFFLIAWFSMAATLSVSWLAEREGYYATAKEHDALKSALIERAFEIEQRQEDQKEVGLKAMFSGMGNKLQNRYEALERRETKADLEIELSAPEQAISDLQAPEISVEAPSPQAGKLDADQKVINIMDL